MKEQHIKHNKIFYSVSILILLLFSACPTSVAAKLLVPVGKTVGITAELKGISVINTAEFETVDGKALSPAKNAGIKAGDIILQINGKDVNSAEELSSVTNKTEGEPVTVSFLRNGSLKTVELKAEKNSDDGKYCIGIWIKDSASGIGTLTYFDPETYVFGALGHGMCTQDRLTEINGGSLLNAEIASVRRGEKGTPGELVGVFSESSSRLGEITLNTASGIFGKLTDDSERYALNKALEAAERSEIREGAATVISNIQDGQSEEFDIEIEKINKDKNDAKCMIIKITDPTLIEKTGGIVQGMSGSPILQNGKLIGAITHVFVNDPTRGYGIFIENMLAEADKIK